MKTGLLKKLADLADELDNYGSVKLAEDVDRLLKELVKEVGTHADKEETALEICPMCAGDGGTDNEAFCPVCRGEGFVSQAKANVAIVKNAFIKKRDGEWCVVSKKNKVLGCHSTREKALRQLRAVEFNKNK
jgi:DnaJ-class molecular chaperone